MMSGMIERMTELAGMPERIMGLLAGLSMLICLLTGCQSAGAGLPDSFDEEEVEEEALRSIGYFNERDYQSILDMGCRELQEEFTAEEFAEQCDPILDKRGKFRKIIKTVFLGYRDEKGEVSCGGVVMVGDYEGGRISFRISMNGQMELQSFLIQ